MKKQRVSLTGFPNDIHRWLCLNHILLRELLRAGILLSLFFIDTSFELSQCRADQFGLVCMYVCI